MIKEYFSNYALHTSDVTVDVRRGSVEVHQRRAEPWRITLVDTGDDSMTGGRLLKVAEHIRNEETFFFTYGDGVGDIDITASLAFHRAHGRKATLTAVAPPGRFGALQLEESRVVTFQEKPSGDGGLINGGFFVLSSQVLSLIQDEMTVWEYEPLHTLAAEGELMAFEHRGFWQPMDTLRDKIQLESLWNSGQAPWKVWS